MQERQTLQQTQVNSSIEIKPANKTPDQSRKRHMRVNA